MLSSAVRTSLASRFLSAEPAVWPPLHLHRSIDLDQPAEEVVHDDSGARRFGLKSFTFAPAFRKYSSQNALSARQWPISLPCVWTPSTQTRTPSSLAMSPRPSSTVIAGRA